MTSSRLLYFIFALVGFTIFSVAQGAPSYTEEQACFDILKDNVKNDTRFGWEDISDAYMDKGNKRADLSQYGKWFLDNRSKNKGDPYFFARRNNIWTIISSSNYIISQFVTFGNSSSFKFPLPSTRPLGEDYGKFRNKIIYTHHLFAPGHPDDGVFVSCAYFRIVPAEWKTLNDVDPSNYKTNDINASGFSLLVWPDSPIEKDGHRFIVGKVNVPVKNFNDELQMTLEMITIAHDTQSELFNEFETFPLQVKAMTDMDARADVNEVQLQFLKNVQEKTCLKIPHWNIDDLPSFCNGEYRSLTKNPIVQYRNNLILNSVLSFLENIIPSASARMETFSPEQLQEHWISSWATIPQGMYINSEFRFDLRQKLDLIKDKAFVNYFLRAVTEASEKELLHKKEKGEKLTDDEQVFLNCGINYTTRTKVLSEWLDGIDPKKFNISDITYTDPRVGDCIIPFPDVRNRSKIIPWSFQINQYNAAILSSNTGEIEKLSKNLMIDNSPVRSNPLGGINYYNPIYNKSARLPLGIILLITGYITIYVIIRRNKKIIPTKNKNQ